MPDNKFDLVIFDLIGTTVRDSVHGGESVVVDSFLKAFSDYGYNVGQEKIVSERGKSKKEAVAHILLSNNLPLHHNEKIYQQFIDSLKKSIKGFSEMEGASELFEWLKKRGIKIAVGSGLPMDVIKEVFAQMNWRYSDFDYIGSSEELGKGRPDPVMIFDAMDKLSIKDKRDVLKVGDTVADIGEGKNAGVATCVLLGTQKKINLAEYEPDYIVGALSELRAIL